MDKESISQLGRIWVFLNRWQESSFIMYFYFQIWNYSQSVSLSTDLLPNPLKQAFKPTFTSKKADPNVGHRCIIFKKAILASSTVFPSCLLYAAIMLCLGKEDTKPVELETGRFPMPSISTQDSISSPLPSGFLPQQQKTENESSCHAMGQGEARTLQCSLFLCWVKEAQQPKEMDFRAEGQCEIKLRKPVFNTHRHVLHLWLKNVGWICPLYLKECPVFPSAD